MLSASFPYITFSKGALPWDYSSANAAAAAAVAAAAARFCTDASTQKKVGVDEEKEKKLITGRGTQSLLLHYHIFHMHLEAVFAEPYRYTSRLALLPCLLHSAVPLLLILMWPGTVRLDLLILFFALLVFDRPTFPP